MSEQKEKIPAEVLLNPELLEKFLDMFETNISYLESQKTEIENARKQTESDLNELKEKKDTLQRYSQFLNAKGFGYTKQTADEFFEQVKNSNSERLAAENPSCGKTYDCFGMSFKCQKQIFHTGDCGYGQ